jgi:hypothetical protein
MARAADHTAALNWESQFCRRQPKKHVVEDSERLKFVKGNKRSLITAICEPLKSQHLGPPDDFTYAALKNYLEDANMEILDLNVPSINDELPQVLLDERQDTNGGENSVREWDSGGYLNYPPPGEAKNTKAVTLRELLEILTDQVCRYPPSLGLID